MAKLSSMQTRTVLKNKAGVNKIPDTSGVYIFKKNQLPLYIGKAISLKNRVSSYFSTSISGKTQDMFRLSDTIGYISVNSEIEAILLEAFLIKKFKPKYNYSLKDDKRPLYIKITNDEYPRILTARKKEENENSLNFYGPFPSSGNVKYVLSLIRNIFPYSTHKPSKRRCLYSQMTLCNPCPSEIVNEKDPKKNIYLNKKYRENINYVRGILSGRFVFVRKNLMKKMNGYSKQQKYELANDTKKIIEKLDYITQSKTSLKEYLKNPNFLEEIRILEIKELKRFLFPYFKTINLKRIECFDVSHLKGASTVASMITFINAEPEKKFYRHFKIQQSNTRDDISSLQEVIKRRIRHLDDWGIPDLIVVDGGKAQVKTFYKYLFGLKIPVVGLAKKNETLVIPKNSLIDLKYTEFIVPSGYARNLLQRMRDEAHRFARKYHKKLLNQSFLNP